MEKDTNPNENNISSNLAGKFALPLSRRSMVVIILLSLLFGAIGGTGGTALFLKNQNYAQFLNSGLRSQNIEQNIKLNEESAIIDVVKKASPAVVSIIITKDLSKIQQFGFDPFSDNFFSPFFSQPFSAPKQKQPNFQEVGAGSGFLVSADGLILTNKHVVSDQQASYTVLTSDGEKHEAKILAIDPRNDLAIVKIEIKNSPFLSFADSSQIQIGQRVVAIGNSLGQYQNTVTTGVVSGIGRSITAGSSDGAEQLSGVIQTDAAINPGNSGGPLLNIVGQVIGINTAIDREGQLVGFAIPSNDINKVLKSFEKYKKIARPYLGVRYIIITKEIASEQKLPKDFGALILRGDKITDFAVIPGSPADKAGLMENDIILEIDGKEINKNFTLSQAINSKEVGDDINLKIYHKGETKDVKIILEESK